MFSLLCRINSELVHVENPVDSQTNAIFKVRDKNLLLLFTAEAHKHRANNNQ